MQSGLTAVVLAGARPGVADAPVERLAAPAPAVRIVSAAGSSSRAERAQDLKLRRRSSGLKFSAADIKKPTSPETLKKPAQVKMIPAVPDAPVKVIPVVKYETIKARSAAKPVVDVFSDPFGDEKTSATQPASLKPVPADSQALSKAKIAAKPTRESRVEPARDFHANPFADDEPLERLVQDPDDRRARAGEEENQIPSFEENLAQGPQARLAPCPSPNELKRIREIKADIAAKSTDLPPECTLGDAVYQPRQFAPTTYTWKASALCHKPLYFEDVSLERYGHSWGPILQPLVSGGKFFATLPILPYEMGIEPPCECVYVLGYYRPGSCAPYMLFPIPLSIRGGLVEAGAVVGAVFVIP